MPTRYAGRGRRPTYCSLRCRRTAEQAPERLRLLVLHAPEWDRLAHQRIVPGRAKYRAHLAELRAEIASLERLIERTRSARH